MVEAAGVEPVTSTENTQVTDTVNACNLPNSTIASFAYKITYKEFQELPELQPLRLPFHSSGRSEVFSDLYTSVSIGAARVTLVFSTNFGA